MRDLSNEELGDLGERKVADWAGRSGMKVSEPGKDRKGWDRFLEFRLRDDEVKAAEVPLDKDSREVKALVQVKTTSRRPGRWKIKLSNLVSLVGHGGPSYFVVLEMDSNRADAEVEIAYIVHVWRDIIADVLKKLRGLDYERLQAKIDGKSPGPIQLNKHKLPIEYEGHALPQATPQAFREALVEPLNGNPQEYLKQKRYLYNRVGYDEKTGLAEAMGKFTVRVPDEYRDSPQEYYTDAAFGSTEPIEIAGGEIRDLRFGIPSVPQTLPESRLLINVPERKVKVRLQRPGLGNRITLDGALQTMQLPMNSNGNPYTAAKLSLAYSDLIFREGDGQLEIRFGFDIDSGTFPLDKLWETADLAQFIREAGEEQQDVTIQFKEQTSPEWVSLPKLEMSEPASISDLQSEEVRTFVSMVKHAKRLANDANLPRKTETSIEQLFESRVPLVTYFGMRQVREGQSTSVGFFFAFDEVLNDSTEFPIVDVPGVGLAEIISLKLGDFTVVVSFAISGVLSPIEVEEGDSQEERSRKEGALASLPDDKEAYELRINSTSYLQPYYFEANETMPDKSVFLRDAFETAFKKCHTVLSISEEGFVVAHTAE